MSEAVIRVMTSGSVKTRLLVVLALALAVRLTAIFAIGNPQQVPRSLAEGDAPTYYVLADHMLDGTGYRYAPDGPPTAKRTPGYPLLLASVFKIFGRNFNAVRGVQCLLDVATTYLVFALAVILFGNPAVGLAAALAYALYLPAIQSTTYIMTETLYAFLLTLSVTAAALALKARNFSLYAASGIALGLATLTRPGVLGLPLAMLVVSFFAGRGQASAGRVFKGCLILLLAFCAALLPWVVRNERALGRFIPASTLMGANLYKGNDLATRGAYFASTDSLLTPDLRARLAGAGEAERDGILRSAAIRMMLSHKRATAVLTLEKIPRLWLNLGYGRAPSKKSLALAAAHLVLVSLAIYGVLRLPAGAGVPSIFPITTIIFSSVMYLAVAAEVRFVFPLIPLLLPYSGLGLAGLWRRLRLPGACP
jgi:4-amino-4-deoxy-L-arabinose transferase-like glycosyltransferase